MFKVKVGQIWKDKRQDDGGTFFIKSVLGPCGSAGESYIIDAYFIAGPYKGTTREWYVDSVDILVADST